MVLPTFKNVCYGFSLQFKSKSQREAINHLIVKAILEAEKKGVKVMSLGLLNQVSFNTFNEVKKNKLTVNNFNTLHVY